MRQRVKFYLSVELKLTLVAIKVSQHTPGVLGPNSKKLWLIKQTNIKTFHYDLILNLYFFRLQKMSPWFTRY